LMRALLWSGQPHPQKTSVLQFYPFSQPNRAI
jgi:hypothetical protein